MSSFLEKIGTGGLKTAYFVIWGAKMSWFCETCGVLWRKGVGFGRKVVYLGEKISHLGEKVAIVWEQCHIWGGENGIVGSKHPGPKRRWALFFGRNG